MTSREAERVLQTLAKIPDTLDHDGSTCGHCCYGRIMAAVAQELIGGDAEDPLDEMAIRVRMRWEETKFYLLAKEARAAGLDVADEFAKRGWEP